MTTPLIPRGLGTIRQTAYLAEDIERLPDAFYRVPIGLKRPLSPSCVHEKLRG